MRLLNRLLFNLQVFRRIGMAHISLTLVGLMWVLPFLYYQHAYPITTFYQEWGAAILGLMASTLLLAKQYWQQPEIPRIVLLPLGLMVIVLLQFMLGMVPYFDQVLLFALYMMWLVLLIMLGRVLQAQFGMAVLTMTLAGFLLLGAELNALAGILQHYRWHTILDAVVTSKNGIAVYGNLAQPNHYANYVMLGLISLGLLQQKIRSWQVALLATPLLFVMVLSGSRSSWLYLLAMVVLSYIWQYRDKSCRYLLNYAWLLLAGFGLMHGLVQLPWLSGASESVTAMQRMMTGDTNGSIRLYLWHEAWLMFLQHPLMGAGFGQFAWQHFQLAPLLQQPHISGLYNNAHNVVMQVAAEMGLAGVAMLLGTVGMFLWQVKKISLTVYHWWAYVALAVMGIHGLLEYPLWYAYFLGVAAILFGVLDTQSYKLELRGLGRLSVAAILLMGLLTLVQLFQGYQRLEGVIALRPKSAVDQEVPQRMKDGLIATHGYPVLHPYAELFMNSWIEVNEDELEQKLALAERSAKFVPISTTVYRLAWLLALSGKQEEARLQLERAIWAYPGDFPEQKSVLLVLAQKYPDQYAALLEFAIQKNEEYLSAISTR
jgi:O-antigen ligase